MTHYPLTVKVLYCSKQKLTLQHHHTLKQLLNTRMRCCCSLLALDGVLPWSHGLVASSDSKAWTRPLLWISYDETSPSSCSNWLRSCRADCRISLQLEPFSRLLICCFNKETIIAHLCNTYICIIHNSNYLSKYQNTKKTLWM